MSLGNQSKYDEINNSNASKICVIAGPGSGKTKGILIPKAKKLMLDKSINPKDVLLISFSRLSAIDLADRVKELENSPRAVTLHSLCLSFLLSEDNHDIRNRINSIVLDFEKEFLISDLDLLLAHKYELNKRKIRKLLTEFSAGWATKPHDQVFIEDDIKIAFKNAVLRWLSEHEAVLMEEIVYHAVDLAKKLETNFINDPQYILVDEFQDLNKLEQEFIEILSKNSKLVLVVGDPNQSIYSFKFSHSTGITNFFDRNDVQRHTLPFSGRCSQKILEVANQLLQQASPIENNYLQPLPNAQKGSIILGCKKNQDEEFEFVYNSISNVISEGCDPKEVLVLVPKVKLGKDFIKYSQKKTSEILSFQFLAKKTFSNLEQEKIILFKLIINPNSILNIRSFIGIKDGMHFSKEVSELKGKYNNLIDSLKLASPDDFDKRKVKIRKVCKILVDLREFLKKYKDQSDINYIIENLFPNGNEEIEGIRNLILSLRKPEDTLKDIYSKLEESFKEIVPKNGTIRVMTLLGSKGLDAEHVYILGCNDGNIPGTKRSAYLTNDEYKQEQRRLLYVGITRGKKNVTLSWSRNIPFSQSKSHSTKSVRTIKIEGKTYSQVGLCQFLQGIKWPSQSKSK